MSKSVKAFLGAMVGVGALVSVASSAQAHHHCAGCAAPPAQYVYHDVTTHSDVYHHINKTHRYPVAVPRVTVHVTRIHPVVHVHNLVTIHEQPYPVYYNVSKSETIVEATSYTYSTSVSYVCAPCGGGHSHCKW